MSRELLILRHGKSDWSTGAATDFERPLKKRGRRDAERMGRWLREQDLLPAHVVSSPARRARETVQRLCEAAGLEEAAVHWEPALYEADLERLLAALAASPAQARRVLLAGHNPELEELLRYLGGPGVARPQDGKLLATATLAALTLPDDWSRLAPGCARNIRITRPRDLPA